LVVEFGNGLGDLLARLLITCGAAFRVGGKQVRADCHEFGLFLGRLCVLDDWLCVEVPTITALSHP
jgi:hypothetical protein